METPRAQFFNSDDGSVDTSNAFQETCKDLGIRKSMRSITTSADNALAESFHAALMREVLQDSTTFTSPLQYRREVFCWCTRDNTVRRHSWCGYLAPAEFEQRGPVILGSAS